MNRLTMTIIVLTVTGGCMAVDHDPVDDYPYGPPRRSSAQSQAWPPTSSGGYRGTDSSSMRSAAADWNTTRSYSSGSSSTSWATPPQTRTAAKKSVNSSGSTSAVASRSTSSPASKTRTDKSDDGFQKVAYAEAKALPDSDTLPTVAKAPSKTLPSATAKGDESKSKPVNLGVLRLLNTKRITFHYEVKDPASAGVAGLEMWGTTDTRSWKKYDIVTRSPNSLVVDVKDEGLYGFSMIARGKGEQTKNQPPQSGEAPQVWVAVDLSKPVVQLLGAELNIMASSPAVVIRWNAKDRNLGPRPITLLYAERVEGPWTPIAANVENNGRYEWTMAPCVPAKVFVRVQAVDMMGNVGMAQTSALNIPGRTSTVAAPRSEPKLAEPPQLGNTIPPPPTCDTNLRPVAATVPNPAVSILSVDGE